VTTAAEDLPRIKINLAPNYVAKMLRWRSASDAFRWQDVEDIASEAWLAYWQTWKRTGKDHPLMFRQDVIDVLRSRSSRKRKQAPCFSDLADGLPEAGARHRGFADVDIEDTVSAIKSDAVRIVLRGVVAGKTKEEAAREAFVSPCCTNYARKTIGPWLRSQFANAG
jgi:hypothetical protein